MKIINYYLLLFLSLLLAIQVSSADEGAKSGKVTFTLITLNESDVPDTVIKGASDRIKQTLKKEGYKIESYRPGFDENITFNHCIKRECVKELRDTAPNGINIIVSVTAQEVKTGQRRVSRYLVEDVTEKKYTIRVISSDPAKNRYDLNFKRALVDSDRINQDAEMIGAEIGKFYINSRPVEKTLRQKSVE